MYVPPGFGTVTPYIFADNAETLVQFLESAFGGSLVLCTKRPNGRIANAQVRIGTTTLMVSESEKRFPPSQSAFYLYVENADQVMQQALAAGGKLVSAVGDRDYGDRQGGVEDPHGNIWWVSQRLVHEPYSE